MGYNFQNIMYFDFVIANSADPNEMLHDAAFYLGFHCLSNSVFSGLQRVNSSF